MPTKSAAKKSATRSGKVAAPRVLAGVVSITRQVHFNSAHRLYNPTKSQKWNEEHYGLCTNPHWHGHNYVLEVTLRGAPDPETGYVMDLGELKRILHTAVVDKCDHRNLNDEVHFPGLHGHQLVHRTQALGNFLLFGGGWDCGTNLLDVGL